MFVTGVRTLGSALFKSGLVDPVTLANDDQIQLVKTPRGPINILFDIINLAIRPALLGLILWVFFWFARDPVLAEKWIDVVGKVPDQMWTVIMILMSSIGISKAIRDFKEPHNGPQMVVVSGNTADGATHPVDPAPDAPIPAPAAAPSVNPTLAAWKAAQANNAH